MAFRLDRLNRVSYAVQVQRQALSQLVARRLHPGDRLPFVRQLACDLEISQTTAERIQDVLCETMVAEIRPRSGAFVALPDAVTPPHDVTRVHAIYEFLNQTVMKASELGLDPAPLASLICEFDEKMRLPSDRTPASFAIIATRDTYEGVLACLCEGFPANLIHLHPNAGPAQFPPRARCVLSGYYLQGRARAISDAVGCPLVYIRYNVRMLDRAMTIPKNEYRWFVTRDADNAETTRGFLASAYPEVPTRQYTVQPIAEFLQVVHAGQFRGTVWATITALPFLKGRVPADRIDVIHPLLDSDFIEELRCLAILGSNPPALKLEPAPRRCDGALHSHRREPRRSIRA